MLLASLSAYGESSSVWCAWRVVLADGSMVACPTVSWTALVAVLPSADDVERFAAHASAGAISTFTSVNRDHFEDRLVDHLYYEASNALVMTQLRQICDTIRPQFDLCRI